MLKQDGIENNMENLINQSNKVDHRFRHALTTEDLYLNKIRSKWFNNKWAKRYFGPEYKKRLAAKIFNDAFYEILLDIINNNITFVIPLHGSNYGEIGAESITGDEFKELYNKGCFRNIDYVLSDFTANKICLKYRIKDGSYKKKPIYVFGELKKLFEQYTNEGKQYY